MVSGYIFPLNSLNQSIELGSWVVSEMEKYGKAWNYS